MELGLLFPTLWVSQRIFGLRSNWEIYRPELRKGQRIKDRTIGPTSQSLQRGWNIKQTRHDPSICRLGYRDTWENLQGTIPCHGTRTTEDHSRIPLVDQDESNN